MTTDTENGNSDQGNLAEGGAEAIRGGGGRTASPVEPRTFPAQAERVESGAVQFGDDWPGIFIRGDNAFYFAMSLRRVLEHGLDVDPFATMTCKGLADTLASCDLTGISLAAAPSADKATQAHSKSEYKRRTAMGDEKVQPPADKAEPLQSRVQPWMMACFGPEISRDAQERNHRFLEESLELVQSCGCTRSEAHQLVDYTFGRPAGEKFQEAGGVMITLAALCLAQGMDMHAAGETELTRIWGKVDTIRAKQAAKPAHSPLPEHPAAAPTPLLREVMEALKIGWVYANNAAGGQLDADTIHAAIAALRELVGQKK